jgi:ATP adenylyltransferase
MERLWAPWRMTYIGKEDKGGDCGCFFCRAYGEEGRERENLLLARGPKSLVMLNRYPYSNAHLMIAPARHVGVMEEATEGEGAELWRMATRSKLALSEALAPEGFNVGINQGRVAGAGVLDHLHIHVVPRWNGDVNFMPVFADVRVIPQALEETWEKLRPFFKSLQ